PSRPTRRARPGRPSRVGRRSQAARLPLRSQGRRRARLAARRRGRQTPAVKSDADHGRGQRLRLLATPCHLSDAAARNDMTEPWDAQMEALGDFIRRRRKLANLSLRQLAERTRLSNPYLSQIERGLHQPSMRVIKLISEALNVSAETLLTHAGLLHHADGE